MNSEAWRGWWREAVAADALVRRKSGASVEALSRAGLGTALLAHHWTECLRRVEGVALGRDGGDSAMKRVGRQGRSLAELAGEVVGGVSVCHDAEREWLAAARRARDALVEAEVAIGWLEQRMGWRPRGALVQQFRVECQARIAAGLDGDGFRRGMRSVFAGRFEQLCTAATAATTLRSGEDAVVVDDLVRQFTLPIRQLSGHLRDVGLLPHLIDTVAACAYAAITRHVEATAAGHFSCYALPPLLSWLERCVWPWLEAICGSRSGASLPDGHVSGGGGEAAYWRARFTHHTYEALLAVRTREMFDVVVDFPDSLPALRDVRDCLAHTDARGEFAQTVRAQFRRRLLQPGAATADQVLHYVNTVKALRWIDPYGLLLESVSEPVRQYWRQNRGDALRCVVETLAAPGGEALFELEASGVDATQLGGGIAADDDKEEEEEDAQAPWQPEPLDAPLRLHASIRCGGAARRPRNADLLSRLIHMVGSREAFVAEYQQCLSERLVGRLQVPYEEALQQVEMLKVRFGDAALSRCEMMLKDVSDSRRLWNGARADGAVSVPDGTTVAPVIASYMCWPPTLCQSQATGWCPGGNTTSSSTSRPHEPPSRATMQTAAAAAMRWPEPLATVTAALSAYYARVKAPRVLHWLPHAGACRVRLQFEDGRVLEVRHVAPVATAVISCFAQRSAWTESELLDEILAPENQQAATGPTPTARELWRPQVRRVLRFWSRHGAIQAMDADTYQVIEYASPPTAAHTAVDALDREEGPDALESQVERLLHDDDVSAASSSSSAASAQPEMLVYENYVLGMLTNFEALPLERIHNLLKMFCTEPPYHQSPAQLAALLRHLVNRGEVVHRHGMYRRRQPADL